MLIFRGSFPQEWFIWGYLVSFFKRKYLFSLGHFPATMFLLYNYCNDLCGTVKHRKVEVDHVEVFFADAGDFVKHLQTKFDGHSDPPSILHETDKPITSTQAVGWDCFDGSSKFEVIVFHPHVTHFAAAIYCICHICKINCRSCNLSNSYPLKSSQLKNTALQANKVNDENVESRHYFLNQGSVCVITANELLIKTVCFAVVTNEEQTSHAEGKDGCGISIQPGESNFKGKCWQKVSPKKQKDLFKLMEKETCVHKFSILYPYLY